jgi:hypothetical protein
MRTVTVYRMNGSTLAQVASGVQTGGADLDVSPTGKFFEMSDGSFSYYPVQTATHTMTLTLEMTRAAAAAIRSAVRYGELYFEGIRIGDLTGTAGTAYRACVTGAVRSNPKYALCDIYCVEIPLRFDVSGDTLQSVEVST